MIIAGSSKDANPVGTRFNLDFLFKYAAKPSCLLPAFEHPDHFLPTAVTVIDEIFLARLSKLQNVCINCYETMNFTQLINELANFLRKDLSGFYLFYAYGAMEDPELASSAYCTLIFALSQFLKLSHPVVPFLSEKLFQQLRYGTGYHKTEYEQLFELQSLNDEKFSNLEDLLNCYQREICSSSIPNEAYLEQLLTATDKLLEDFLNQDVIAATRNWKSSTESVKKILIQTPNYPLISPSLQVYFKRILQMKM